MHLQMQIKVAEDGNKTKFQMINVQYVLDCWYYNYNDLSLIGKLMRMDKMYCM